MYKKFGKRFFDIIFSLIGLVVLVPVFLIVSILIRIKYGNPVIFKQERPGLHGKIFTIFKFRTMSNEKDKNGVLLDDNLRLKKFGKILRKLSLDEIPQLWNILKGDMSFIGPRPLAVVYLPYYTTEELKRHDVRPGITGLAQINGRNNLQWEERFAYDLQYVNNISFITDIKIVFKTIYKTLKSDNIQLRGTGKTIDFDVYRKGEKK